MADERRVIGVPETDMPFFIEAVQAEGDALNAMIRVCDSPSGPVVYLCDRAVAILSRRTDHQDWRLRDWRIFAGDKAYPVL